MGRSIVANATKYSFGIGYRGLKATAKVMPALRVDDHDGLYVFVFLIRAFPHTRRANARHLNFEIPIPSTPSTKP